MPGIYRSVPSIVSALQAIDRDDGAALAAIEVVKKYTYTVGAGLGVLTPYAEPKASTVTVAVPVPAATRDQFRQLTELLKPWARDPGDSDHLDRLLHAELCRANASVSTPAYTSGVQLNFRPDPKQWVHLAIEADRTLNRLKSRLTDTVPAADGPMPPNQFWWKGKRHELAIRQWQILNRLWPLKASIALQEVIDDVWGRSTVAESTVRSALSVLNTRLLKIGVPRHFHINNGYVVGD
jgi:hypothetical protein